MKRLRVILLFLLLGAIINVGVAWGIALTISVSFASFDSAIEAEASANERWDLERMVAFGTQNYTSFRSKIHIDEGKVFTLRKIHSGPMFTKIKPEWGSMHETTDYYKSLPGPPGGGPVIETRDYEARGWPLLSLWCVLSINVDDGTGDTKWFSPQGLIATPILRDDYWGAHVLPLYPIWTGFLVNTMFYGAFFWMMFPGRRAVHQTIRRKRGRCQR